MTLGRIAFIGGGNMGGALASGLLEAGTVKPSQIFVSDVDQNRRRSLEKLLGVRTGPDNAVACAKSRIVVLCVKPQQMEPVLTGLRGRIEPRQLVVSIAAGIRTSFIEKTLGNRAPVIRVMPNTPALFRAGAMVYCLGRHAKKADETLARTILSSVGRVWKTKEDLMDAVTALSGSGPAYVFYLAECLSQAAQKLGLPQVFAEELSRQTVFGAGLMLGKSAEPAVLLRHRVTSPGGTTEAALQVLAREHLSQIFTRALSAASRRSRKLSKA
ncbi:MAG: pyrroline-5-carboxylate reductase [Elusimicrobia bacterium]|nr:pyrroline-5-carboxylate reductase [Elusimicrobiota bacterium]